MKPTNATLNALLATRQFITADLYTISLVGGTVLYYCSGQTDITNGGHTYSAGGQTGPYFDRKGSRAKVTWKIGSGTDSLVIDVAPGTATVQGLTFLNAIRVGLFDGADFQLARAFMSVYGTVATGCAVTMFKGRIAEIDADRSLATITINDYRELFNQQLPRNLFAASCANTLYDAQCTVVAATYSAAGIVLTGSTATSVNVTLAQPTGYFDLGMMTFTSGANNGMRVGVSTWVQGVPGILTPIGPIPTAPAVGDTFTVYAGCDRTLGAGGCTRFANSANFRGAPYVPAPESVL